jgi:ABC-type glycerol-3-phosphate transport system substrate-binding protein
MRKKLTVSFLVISVVFVLFLSMSVFAQNIKIYMDPAPGAPDPNTGIVIKSPIEIAEEYQKSHPDVKIEYIVHPWTSEQDMRLWHITQLTGGTVPDLYQTQPNWIREDLAKGWFLSVDEILAEQNPYYPEYNTWEDTFLPNTLDIWKLVDEKRYSIQMSQQQVVFYYNKDIFNELGISEPETWRQFIEILEKVKAAGYTPLAWNLSDLNQLTWTSGWFTNFVFYDIWQKYNLNGDNVLSDWEIATAVKNGTLSATMPEYMECLRLMQEFSQYWSKGAVGTTRPACYRSFITGEAAIFLDGTWDLFGIENDNLREFEYGMFYYPRLTPKDSKFITSYNVPMNNKAAGYGTIWSIPAVTKERGTFDAAVDFWRFFTTPENMTRFCTEAYTIPNVKGAKAHPLLDPIIPTLSYPMYIFEEEDVWLTIEYGVNYLKIWQDIYSGSITLEEAAEKMQKYLVEAADKVLETKAKVSGS